MSHSSDVFICKLDHHYQYYGTIYLFKYGAPRQFPVLCHTTTAVMGFSNRCYVHDKPEMFPQDPVFGLGRSRPLFGGLCIGLWMSGLGLGLGLDNCGLGLGLGVPGLGLWGGLVSRPWSCKSKM